MVIVVPLPLRVGKAWRYICLCLNKTLSMAYPVASVSFSFPFSVSTSGSACFGTKVLPLLLSVRLIGAITALGNWERLIVITRIDVVRVEQMSSWYSVRACNAMGRWVASVIKWLEINHYTLTTIMSCCWIVLLSGTYRKKKTYRHAVFRETEDKLLKSLSSKQIYGNLRSFMCSR